MMRNINYYVTFNSFEILQYLSRIPRKLRNLFCINVKSIIFVPIIHTPRYLICLAQKINNKNNKNNDK